jgi:hypothetical protein
MKIQFYLLVMFLLHKLAMHQSTVINQYNMYIFHVKL